MSTRANHPNHRFIGAELEFDKLVARLKEARAAHFGVAVPDSTRTKEEADRAELVVHHLREALKAAGGKPDVP